MTESLHLAKVWPMNIAQDLRDFLQVTGWNPLRLAEKSGANKDSLYRLINGERAGINSKTFEKIQPFLYGDKHPDKKNQAA